MEKTGTQRGPKLARIAALGLAFWQVAAAAQSAPDAPPSDYRPGQGWTVPGTNVGIGGYATLGYQNLTNETESVGLEEVSLLLHWEGQGRFRFFSEISVEDPIVYEPGSGILSGQSYIALERVYGEYLFSDALKFRVGKFLTPIGRWNVIHADPLVWTTSRPLITEHAFPTNATGAMAYGSVTLAGRTYDYSVYGALGSDWRPNPRLDPFSEAYGMHVATSLSARSELGVSLVSFEQRSSVGERRKLVGIDYVWHRGRTELSAEAAYRFSDEGGEFHEKGLFVQGVAPLSRSLYAVGRYEYYDAAGMGPHASVYLLGLAYKPTPWLVMKLEVRDGQHVSTLAPPGFLASIAVLY
ncbi:MAG: hypothetical protein ABIR55_11950 [Burkholderiaceae bacterium]